MVKWHLAIKIYLENKKALYALEHTVYPVNISSTYILKISDIPPLQPNTLTIHMLPTTTPNTTGDKSLQNEWLR